MRSQEETKQYFAKRCKDYREYKNTTIIDVKQISAYDPHTFMVEYLRAQEEGFEYCEFEGLYAACQIGPLITCTVVKYAPKEPEVPKEVDLEVAEIQEKFADQQGAAAAAFTEPTKAKRGPKPKV